MKKKQRITVGIYELDWKFFSLIVKEVGLRRDAYLSEALHGELDLFEKMPPNPPDSEGYWKWSRRGLEKFKKQVSLTLPADLVARIGTICSKKRVPRDEFLSQAIKFLNRRLIVPAMIFSNPRKWLGMTERDMLKKVPDYYLGLDGDYGDDDLDAQLDELESVYFSDTFYEQVLTVPKDMAGKGVEKIREEVSAKLEKLFSAVDAD
jgi:hypothetical protein